MLECDLLVLGQIVFKFLGALRGWLHGERLSADHASNVSVASVDSLDLDLDFLCAFAYSDVSVAELNCSWEVLIQNGDLALGVITWQPIIEALLSLGGVVQLNPEFEVRVPFFIINNWDLNLLLLLTLAELNFLVYFLVILGGDSCIIAGTDTDNELLVDQFLDNGNFDVTITLGYGIVQAFETDQVVLFFHVLSGIFIVIKLSFGSFDSHEFLGVASIPLPVSESFKQLLWLQCLQQIVNGRRVRPAV